MPTSSCFRSKSSSSRLQSTGAETFIVQKTTSPSYATLHEM
jgi:hypothetical protein